MARRGSRKVSRKSGRKSSRKGGLVGMAWSPFKHLLMATGESGQKIGSTAGKIVRESVGAVEGVGSSFARHSNQALGNLTRFGKGRRNSRRNTMTRRSRRSRRNH